MAKKIILKFTPNDYYFFGKENTGKKGGDNYFLKSNAVPPPSTILGAVRYWMLLVSDLLVNGNILDKNEASKTIGADSFQLNGDFKMSKLESVSNLFLLDKNNKKYLPAPLCLDTTDSLQFEFKTFPIIKKYNPKTELITQYTNGTTTLKDEDIFKSVIDNHNRKNNRIVNDEDAFFKTEFYYLKNNFSFGVEIEVADDFNPSNTTPITMKMGGENKLFKVEILNKKDLASNDTILKNYANGTHYKLVFISDVYLENLQKTDYLFGILHTKTFRSIIANINNLNNYNALDKTANDKAQLHKSKMVQLIKAGSVLYFDTEDSANTFISKYIENENNKKAGFNQITLLQPNKNN